MSKALIPIVLAVLVGGLGCAVRKAVTPAEATPAAIPGSTPRAATGPRAVHEPRVAGAGSDSSPQPPVDPAPARAATTPAVEGGVPPASASAYVFAPEQAIASRPSPSPSGTAPPEAQSSAAGAGVERGRQDTTAGNTPGALRLVVVASVPVIAAGAIMAVDVMASSSAAVVDAPLHLTFDPNVLEFVDGTPGDFLTQGGSSIVFLADGRSRPGEVAVAAGRVERERGASGAGLLCRVRFRGVRAGATPVLVGDAKVWGVRGEELTVLAGGTNVVVH
jgi:hypothetical protein